MPFLPRSTGYVFLALYALSVASSGAGWPYVLVYAARAALLVRASAGRPMSRATSLTATALPAVLLAYAPLLAAGRSAPNLDCLLAATLLRCLDGPLRWPVFALVCAGSGLVHDGGPYAVLSTAAIGTVLHILLRLPDLVTRLDATREQLARAAVAAQRLQVAQQLQAALGDRLAVVTALLRRARDAGLADRQATARDAAAEAGRTVRAMTQEVRATAAGLRQDIPPATQTEPGTGKAERLPPQLAMMALAVSLTAWTARQSLEDTHHQLTVGLGGAVLSGLLLAQLRLPRWSLGLLAAQATITLLPLPWLGADWCAWLILLAAAILLQPRPWWPVPAALGLVALRAAYTEHPDQLATGSAWAVLALQAVLVLFGLARFWQLSSELNGSRAELVATSVELERWRLARDIHDLLGLSLSVLALKSDLIAELITRQPDRADAEIDEALRITARARAEAQAALADHWSSSLRHELAAARESLGGEGITVRVSGDHGLPEGTALAPVLREAVTNILRHSAASHVDIEFRHEDGELHMTVRNDGVHDASSRPPGRGPEAGRGLRNIRARTAQAGGSAIISAEQGTFLVSVRVPVDGDATPDHADCTSPTPR